MMPGVMVPAWRTPSAPAGWVERNWSVAPLAAALTKFPVTSPATFTSGHLLRAALKPVKASLSLVMPGMPWTWSTLPLPPIAFRTWLERLALARAALAVTLTAFFEGTVDQGVMTGMPAAPAWLIGSTKGSGARGKAMIRSGFLATI